MFKKFSFALIISLSILATSGCKFSPLSPNNNPNINNGSGDIGDIKNNQNGILADIAAIRKELDVVARDVRALHLRWDFASA